MNRFLKIFIVAVGVLVGVVLLGVAVLLVTAQNRLNQAPPISIEPIPIPAGPADQARGEHLVRNVSVCTGCHGEDLAGRPFIDTPVIGQIYAPNLTGGQGGAASRYRPEDWVRVLRHGIAKDGRILMFMPAQNYRFYGDADLGAIAAYLQSLPPVDRETPPRRLALPGRILFVLGAFGEVPAEVIDHQASPPASPPEGVTAQYGEFMVTVAACAGCHAENLAGGRAGPDDPFAPNLTPGGELVGWTEADFMTLIRTGVHPSGRQINPNMPWQAFRGMTDTELRAIWAYLQSLPALPTNQE